MKEATPHMVEISRDIPCLYITTVAHQRLPVFQSEKLKTIAVGAMDEARTSGKFLVFAYVIMPDHFHLITDGSQKPSKVLQYVNGIASRRVIGYLKENGFESSLKKLRHETGPRRYKHSLVEHHSNVFLITNEATFMQKVNYMHQNPVRAKIVERAADYLWSSYRIWQRLPSPNEPLKVDLDQIRWRQSK